MRSRSLKLILAFAAAVALPFAASAQQLTGGVIFEVADTEGNIMPGVTITVDGENLPGFQLNDTDERGRARFVQLPAGTYIAEFIADGFITVRRDFKVRLGGTQVVPMTMTAGELSEEVDVLAQTVIDTSVTSNLHVWDEEALQNIQIGSAGRSYQSVLQQAPGVGGGANPAVHGSTIGENRYLIDGVDTTDPVTGTFGQNTNFDALEQVEFVTGGFEAEYGQVTGGLVNLVTKSGGNDVEVTFDTRYDDQRFRKSSPYFDEIPREFRQHDFTIGGPIKKDKLWYFLSVNSVLNRSRSSGDQATREYDGKGYLGKLTWQANPDHRVSFQYSADPADISHANHSPFVSPEAGSLQEQGSNFFSLNYFGTLNDRWSLTGQFGDYTSSLDVTPLNDSGLPSSYDYDTTIRSQNYNDIQLSERKRRQYKMVAEYVPPTKRVHDFKFGVEIQDVSFDSLRDVPAGRVDFTLARLLPGDDLIRYDLYNSAGWVNNPGLIRSFFAQDTFSVTDKLTLNYGLRWDDASFDADTKATVIDVGLLQPRLGGSYDFLGDGTRVFKASYARVMHPGILTLPPQVNTRVGTTDTFRNEVWFGDCDGDTIRDDVIKPCGSFGGPGGSVIAAAMDATYIDEINFGYSHAIQDNMVLKATFVARDTKDIIEDRYNEDLGEYLIDNIPELERTYRGLEIEYQWDARRWHVGASWTISSSKGNVEYTQGLGSDWDFPYHETERYGYLSTDRKHRLKIQGWVDLPKKWRIAYDAFLGSGLPYNRTSVYLSEELTRVDYGVRYIDPRGAHRLSSIRTLNLEVKKYFDLGKNDKTRLTIIGSINNVFDANTVTSVRTSWDPPTEDENGDPIAVEDRFDPRWGEPTGYQTPRRYQLGLRIVY